MGIFRCPCPSPLLPFPRSANEYNRYFVPHQEEGTPETAKGVESRCLPVPGFYAVLLLELLRSHLTVPEGQCVDEKEEFCVI